VHFANPNGTTYIRNVGPTTLTVGPDVLVHGGRANIGQAEIVGGPMTVANQGTIRADMPGQSMTWAAPGGTTNTGTMEATDSSTLAVTTQLFNEGQMAIAATASMNVGSFSQGARGVLAVVLSGTSPSTYGQLTGSAPMVLAGLLVVTVDGFVPLAGDTFDVVTYPSLVGSFDGIDGLDVGGGIALEPAYLPQSLRLTAVVAAR
ncbi:MAG: hypothetical protein ACYTF9_08100, partial [Planctomycetota bacterium]|jgi:hypothetical protein